MTTLAHTAGALALLVLVAGQPACDALRPTATHVSVPELKLPPPRPPKRQRTVEEALAVFPSLDEVKRDPFLTAAEQTALEAGTPVKEGIAVVAPPPVVKRSRKKKKLVPQLEDVKLELESLFTSPDGKRHAVARDVRTGRDLQIDEGQTFGEFVVTSISDDAIRLREKHGPIVRVFPFRRAATDIWLPSHGK